MEGQVRVLVRATASEGKESKMGPRSAGSSVPQVPRSTTLNTYSSALQLRAPPPDQRKSRAGRPAPAVRLRLLDLALRSTEEKKSSHHKQDGSTPRRSHHHAQQKEEVDPRRTRVANPNPLDSSVARLILPGKVPGRGAARRQRERVSTLKRRILGERRICWWFQHPEQTPYPLMGHSSLVGFTGLWLDRPAPLGREYSSLLRGEEASESSSGEEEEEETPMGDAIKCDTNVYTTNPVFFGCTCARQPDPLLPGTGPARPPPKLRLASAADRPYLTQALCTLLDQQIYLALSKLYGYQDKVRREEPAKAAARKRVVLGLREVERAVKSRRVVSLVLASNVEPSDALYANLQEILRTCREGPMNAVEALPWVEIPVVFVATKRGLGKAFRKDAVSVAAIASADGANEEVKLCLKLAELARNSMAWLGALRGKEACAGCRAALAAGGSGVLHGCLRCRRRYCEACASRHVNRSFVCEVRDGEEYLRKLQPRASEGDACVLARAPALAAEEEPEKEEPEKEAEKEPNKEELAPKGLSAAAKPWTPVASRS